MKRDNSNEETIENKLTEECLRKGHLRKETNTLIRAVEKHNEMKIER